MFRERLALQQRVLTNYRAPFFDALAGSCPAGLSVFAGQPLPEEAIETASRLQVANYEPAHNLNLLRGPLYVCWQAGMRRWLSRWQPAALIVEANRRNVSNPPAIRWMHARGKPVIGWGLGTPASVDAQQAGRNLGYRRFIGQFDALITYSRRGAEAYQANGFPENRIFIAPNAATHRPTRPPAARPAQFEGRPVVLFVGRLQARKRIDALLRACAALPAALQPRVQIVGDGPARAAFEQVAQAVYPGTEFLGARYGADLDPLYANADLFVLPGTGGLAVQQAMAYGLPVLVAEADGTQEDLVRPENGWLVPPGSLPALTEALHEALQNPARLRQMGAASYQIVDREINLENMVAVFLRALQEVTQPSGAVGPAQRQGI